MPREPYVFYCEGSCKRYVLVNLDTDLEGEHVIICPKCHHKHFRKVKAGQITDFRHSCGNTVDTIEPMPSAVFETREEAEAAMGLSRDESCSFLSSLWGRKAQDEGWKS